MKRRFLCLLISIATAAGFAAVSGTTSASAVTGSAFQPGNIISDQLFYNPNTMGAAEIQNFLAAHYAGCNAGYTCMRDYTVNTPNEPAEAGLCNGYAGAPNESAAAILAKISVSCGINPQALLVLIQKESSLITSKSPTYTQVTGFSCPDSTGCDAAYFGYFNQVYLAARQFKRYRLTPNNYGYVAGRSNFILYNPNTGCGGTQVYIQNQATAGLYDYTPYQPDAAALNNLSGLGDACSTYGNRNFWVFFNNWFGPTGFVAPVGGTSVSCLGSSAGGSSASSLLSGSLPSGTASFRRQADVVAIDGNGGAWYYQNAGTATPFTVRGPATGSSLLFYNELALGDVSGDGRADLIATAPDGSLWYYLGNGTSTPFSSGAVQIGSTGWAAFNWIGLGDVNGDGRADLLATSPDGRLWYYQNNGTASPFTAAPTVLGTGWQTNSTISVGDVNGDGKADLITTTPDGKLSYYQNTGNANPFTTATVLGASGWNNFNRVILADIDGDAHADLITTTTDGRLFYYHNNGTTAPYPTATVIGAGGWQNYPTLLMANVHGTAAIDLIGTRPDGSLWYYQNNGTTTPYVGLGNVGTSGWNNFDKITHGDVNGDGLDDLVTTSSDGRLWYYPNTNNCSPFSRAFIIGNSGWNNFTRIQLGDVNGDGFADLIATATDGRLWYYPNNHTGTPYTTPTIIGAGGWQNFTTITLGDTNGDGKADLIATSTDGRLWDYQNNGTTSPYSTPPTIIGAGGWQNFTTITLGDANGDNKADLIATSADGRLWYYQNNGTTTPYTTPNVIGPWGWNAYNRIL